MQFFPLPSFMGHHMWGWEGKGYQFVISTDGHEWRGSWKNSVALDKPAVFVDGSFGSLQEAEAACRYTLKALQNKN